jgi:hypothetical protein
LWVSLFGVDGENVYLREFFLAFRGFSLARLDFDFVCRVLMYESSVAAAINVVFFCEVVGIEESLSHARNADKKSSCMPCFTFARAQCCIPKRAFQLGSLPGIFSVSSKQRRGGVWEESDVIGLH